MITAKIMNTELEIKEYKIKEGSLKITDRLNERSVASLTIITSYDDNFMNRSKAEIYNDGKLLFAGIIDLFNQVYAYNRKFVDISLADNHYYVDKRIIAKSYENKFAGEIVKDIVDTVLNQEGIVYSVNSIDNGKEISVLFNYEYCNDAMDKICEHLGGQYVWWVDNEKIIHFKKQIDIREPNSIEITDKTIILDSFNIEKNRYAYRNVQYIKGGKGNTATETDVITFIGGNKISTLYPVGEISSISEGPSLETQYLVDLNDISEKHIDDQKRIVWEEGSNVITYTLPPEPSSYEVKVIIINYYGQIPIVGLSKDFAQISALKNIEGGSGIVENVSSEPGIKGNEVVLESANGKIMKYSVPEQIKLNFDTLAMGYEVGQIVTVNLETEGYVNNQYLIEQVIITEKADKIWYNLQLVNGNIYESWSRIFQKSMELDNTAANEKLKVKDTLLISYPLETIWYPTDQNNPFYVIYPNDSLYPSIDLIPGFKDYRGPEYVDITYELNNETFTERFISSNVTITETTIENTFYINPNMAVGKWSKLEFFGGEEAMNEEGTGVLIKTEDSVLEKSQYNSIRINRKEIKGW